MQFTHAKILDLGLGDWQVWVNKAEFLFGSSLAQ
jgi:hypothetical protein